MSNELADTFGRHVATTRGFNDPHHRADRRLMEVHLTGVMPFTVAQMNYITVYPPGQNIRKHRHQGMWEAFMCLEGVVHVLVEGSHGSGNWRELTSHQWIVVEPGLWHRLLAPGGTKYLEYRSAIYEDGQPDKEFASSNNPEYENPGAGG